MAHRVHGDSLDDLAVARAVDFPLQIHPDTYMNGHDLDPVADHKMAQGVRYAKYPVFFRQPREPAGRSIAQMAKPKLPSRDMVRVLLPASTVTRSPSRLTTVASTLAAIASGVQA